MLPPGDVSGWVWQAGGGAQLLILPPLTSASRTCEEPASSGAHIWPDDITKWPVSVWGGEWSRKGRERVRVSPLQGPNPVWACRPPRRSAPSRPRVTEPASYTWIARSRAAPAASAPRAGKPAPCCHLPRGLVSSLPHSGVARGVSRMKGSLPQSSGPHRGAPLLPVGRGTRGSDVSPCLPVPPAVRSPPGSTVNSCMAISTKRQHSAPR